MKVKVLKSVGATGFRPVGMEYEVQSDFGLHLISMGFVKDLTPKPKPKKRAASSKKAK